MLIPVLKLNGDYVEVQDVVIDKLLAAGEIMSFLRSDGWVLLGEDPTRANVTNSYHGPERRINNLSRTSITSSP